MTQRPPMPLISPQRLTRKPDEMRHHTGMDTLQALEQRITDLEIKASFAEDTVETLNQVVVRQQAQIDRLVRELVELRDQAAPSVELGGFRSLRDELPPHY